MNPLVTIAIPTFSRLGYLKEAVASALAQTDNSVEVLIGNDGPTQDIHAWCETVRRGDARVRYQKNAHRLGLAGNWNALADSARGEYLVIIGDDDRLLPEFISRLTQSIGDANVAFSNHWLIDQSGRRLEAESIEHTKRYHREDLAAGLVANVGICVWRNSVPMSSALIRTADVRRLRFREELNTPEIEFFLRVAREGGRFMFIPDYLCEYRVHPQSATSAGLNSEALADCLLPFPVNQDTEPYKREFVGLLLRNAASRCLLQGDTERARRYLASEYYPLGGAGLVQRLCTGLPGRLGGTTYRTVHWMKKHLRG